LFFPFGAGYLYVGAPIRYAVFLLLITLNNSVLLLAPSGWLSEPIVLIGLQGIYIVLLCGMALDVVWQALKRVNFQLRWYNRWWVYVGSILLGVVIHSTTDLVADQSDWAVRMFSIPAESNAPTLLVGDYIVVDNKAYEHKNPIRGDMVVFKVPRDNTTDYVQRVMGLPGDKIQLIGGVVFVNSVQIKRQQQEDFVLASKSKVRQFLEILPDGRSYLTLDIRSGSLSDDTGVYIVPKDHYFMLGDNRDNSNDSRFSFVGFVPRKNIFAHAKWIFYSKHINRIGKLIN